MKEVRIFMSERTHAKGTLMKETYDMNWSEMFEYIIENVVLKYQPIKKA